MLFKDGLNSNRDRIKGLNPYSNGICSLSRIWDFVRTWVERLNPYSNGICSLSLNFVNTL